ncbi:MAG: MFS transporter [Spirochaetaceae bacterium]|nr:MFS transporter [Spirochaetaceae bacterium]
MNENPPDPRGHDTRPAEPAGDRAYRNLVRRNGRWNFWVNVGDLSFVNLAGSFVFISTILPLYVSYLTESRVMIGLIPAVYLVASHLPQLLMAARAESLARKKPWIVRISVFERVPWLVLGLGILLWPVAPAWFSYLFLVAMLLVAQGAVGVASPAWRAMLAKIIHPDRKGMMFGLGAAIGALMGAGGALLARHILDTMPYPRSFAACFVLAFAGQAISWTFLTFNREPAHTPERSRVRLGAYLRELPAVLRRDHNFARFLLSQLLVIFGALGVTFYVIYAREAFAISDSFAATLTVAALISQAVGTPLIGWWGDRFGHRAAIEVAALLCAAAGVVVLVAPAAAWMYAAFALLSLSDAGIRVSRPSLAMDLGAAGRVATYTALTTTLLAAPALAAPIAGGWLIDTVNYRTVFAAGVVLSLGGWLLLRFGVADPRVARRPRAGGSAGRPPKVGRGELGSGRRRS